MRIRSVATGLAAVALAVSAVTLAALEGGAVAVLTTVGSDGGERRTRVWYAEDGEELWIEAATASRPFVLDLVRHPRLIVEIRDRPLARWRRFPARAELAPEPGGHDRIRRLLRERYGWADAWIALLQDTSSSRALRVVPDPGPH